MASGIAQIPCKLFVAGMILNALKPRQTANYSQWIYCSGAHKLDRDQAGYRAALES